MKGLKKILGKRVTMLLAAMTLSAVLTGCGSSALGSTSYMAIADNSSYKYASVESAEEFFGYDEGGALSAMPVETPASGEAKAEVTDAAATERKLIKTVNMNVETREFDRVLAAVDEQVKTLGGYIESRNTYNGSSYNGYRTARNADMTIRIPEQQLDSFLNTVSGISNVIRRSDNVEDVTLAYVDLESHRDALRTEQTRLLELLERAESIEDIITIEERLSNVRYQLESMESQLRTFDNQVDYSTVYLNIEEVEIYTPVEKESIGMRISSGFAESLRDIGEGFVDFGVWFVVTLPYMVVWAVIIVILIGIIYAVVKLFQRAGSRKHVKSAPKTTQPGHEIKNIQQENPGKENK